MCEQVESCGKVPLTLSVYTVYLNSPRVSADNAARGYINTLKLIPMHRECFRIHLEWKNM